MKNHLNWGWSVALGQDAQTLFSSSWDGTIKSCHLATGEVQQTM